MKRLDNQLIVEPFSLLRLSAERAVDVAVDAKKSTKTDENLCFRRLLRVQGTCKRRIPADDASPSQRGPPHDEKPEILVDLSGWSSFSPLPLVDVRMIRCVFVGMTMKMANTKLYILVFFPIFVLA